MSRPHAGLSDPEKFGLTYEEVVELIETGKWKNFYSTWHQKEQRKKARDDAKPWTRQNGSIRIKRDKNGIPIEEFKCISCKKMFPIVTKHFKIGEFAQICWKCAKCLQKLK